MKKTKKILIALIILALVAGASIYFVGGKGYQGSTYTPPSADQDPIAKYTKKGKPKKASKDYKTTNKNGLDHYGDPYETHSSGGGCGGNKEISGTGTFAEICVSCDDAIAAREKPYMKCKQTTFQCVQTTSEGISMEYTAIGAPYDCTSCIPSCDPEDTGYERADTEETDSEDGS